MTAALGLLFTDEKRNGDRPNRDLIFVSNIRYGYLWFQLVHGRDHETEHLGPSITLPGARQYLSL